MMSLQRYSSTLIMHRKMWWYKGCHSAANMSTQWSRSLPIRCSMVISSMAISICYTNNRNNGNNNILSSCCKCECDECNELKWRENLHLRILAGSPHQGDISVQQSLTKPPRQKWWRLQWWRQKQRQHSKNDTQNNDTPTWWQRLHRTVITLTRGIEIVVRLSPLLILTPTAMLVSNVKSLFNNDNRSILLHNKREENGNNDDLFAITPFQSNISQQQHHHSNTTTWVSDLSWRYTLHTLQCLGPAFVKLGQWAATRRDLFPVHVCIRLSKLHDTANIHAWKYTHESLVEAFGEDYESRGLVVRKDDILGSGSAAQVHRGTLSTVVQPMSNTSTNQEEDVQLQRTTIRDVAIKVLHPNTRQLVERDLELMSNISQIIDKCIPLQVVKMLSLPRAVSNFRNVMSRQVDLRIEGTNLQIFRQNFGCYDNYDNSGGFTTNIKRRYSTIRRPQPPNITFPKPQQDWISEKVLVEQHAGDDALPISIYLADDSPEGLERRKKLAGPLLRGFLKMVFIDNFIHCDLHPGNVLVKAIPTTNGSSQGRSNNPRKEKQEVHYTIIFLDAGIATSLQPNDKKNLKDLFKAVVLNDGYTAGELMVERARYERCTSIPGGKHAFAQGVSDIVEEFHDRRKQGKLSSNAALFSISKEYLCELSQGTDAFFCIHTQSLKL